MTLMASATNTETINVTGNCVYQSYVLPKIPPWHTSLSCEQPVPVKRSTNKRVLGPKWGRNGFSSFKLGRSPDKVHLNALEDRKSMVNHDLFIGTQYYQPGSIAKKVILSKI